VTRYKITAPHPIDLGAPGDFITIAPDQAEELITIGHLTAASEAPKTGTPDVQPTTVKVAKGITREKE
jgi:hypothetical protein